MRIRSLGISVSGGFALAMSSLVIAEPPVFTVTIDRVLDTSTPLPNDPSLSFATVDPTSVLNLGNSLLFSNLATGGFQNPSENGLYSASGSEFETLATTGVSPFEGGALFDQTSFEAGPTLFRARQNIPGGIGSSIWMHDSAGLTNLVPMNAELPGGAGSAQDLRLPRISGSDVLFVGAGSEGQPRIYHTTTHGSPIETVIGISPQAEHPEDGFDLGDFQGDQFVFRTLSGGFGPGTGVFAGDLEGNTTEFARIGDPVPGHEGEDEFFRFAGGTDHPAMDNGRVAFIGQGLNGIDGVYTSTITDNTLEVVVDDTMELPNDNGLTHFFSAPSISGDNISFIGVGENGRGIAAFVSIGGTIVDVIHKGDTLDGRVVDDIFGSSFGLHGNTLAFTVRFDDDTRGLYLATVIPSPGSGFCLMTGGTWAARRKRVAA